VASGTLPVTLVGHRYDVPGVYTLALTVRDGRASATAEREVTVTNAQGDTPPAQTPLTLTLSSASLSLGTFVPGLASDYTATLTATMTGGDALTVADRGVDPGRLLSPAGALEQPLSVRSTSGAFVALTRIVPVPATIEFRQSIGADEVLRPGTYTKPLTFTLAVTSP